jgi:SAM-dependent methyltransferase
MYEENPYPRWRAARFHGEEPLLERFRHLCPDEPEPSWPSPLPVLVAGAGTGRHPEQVALRLPEAEVLAVDLSRTSLAYGARMAAHLGLQRVRFAQADILALDVLDQRFALIESGGVLHHLADPLAGWAVLRRLLRPDGLMRIGLYSERARASVVAARALIAAEGYGSTLEGIRAARARIAGLPADHPAAGIAYCWDFYSQSGFRDLAMHVQEHRFTLPRLAASLDALDLRFVGFSVSAAVLERFRARFPAPGAELDLACWDQFEAEEPWTFAAMYQFWCAPR